MRATTRTRLHHPIISSTPKHPIPTHTSRWLVKYCASCVALLVYAAPLYLMDPAVGVYILGEEELVHTPWAASTSDPKGSCIPSLALSRLAPTNPSQPTPTNQPFTPQARGDQSQLTGDYIRSMRLLQNTSRAVGDLIMVYKRVSNLAGHTARVAELLEQVGAEPLDSRPSTTTHPTLMQSLILQSTNTPHPTPPHPTRSTSCRARTWSTRSSSAATCRRRTSWRSTRAARGGRRRRAAA